MTEEVWDGAELVRLAFDGAEAWQPSEEDGDGDGHGDSEADWDPGEGRDLPPGPDDLYLPQGSPIRALGVNGRVYYLLDAFGQLQEIPWKELGRSTIIGLVGDGAHLFLEKHWPRKTQNRRTQEWETSGWRPEEAQMAIHNSCARQGIWSPRTKVRGAGAWATRDGGLAIHCGDAVLIFGRDGSQREEPPGVVDGFVYPTAPATLRPAKHRMPAGAGGPAMALYQILRTWHWKRADIDPVLMLGWICAAMVGGALKARPMIWIPGELGTGKSSLQDLVKWIFMTTGLLSVADPTEAALAQTLGFSTMPAALDEQESSQDNRKLLAILNLARLAFTGAVRSRGSQDHEARDFVVRSAFMFSSILPPPMDPQDVSRFAFLELLPLSKGAKPPPIDEARIGELGMALLRRMTDGWPRWTETLQAFREALMESGNHTARGADLFGTLLAAAHLAMSDSPPSAEQLAKWAAQMDATKLAELDGAMSDKQACLAYVSTKALVDQHNRRERTIASWVARAAGIGTEDDGGQLTEEARLHANRILALVGMVVRSYRETGLLYLVVSNNHEGTAKLFAGTKWGTTAGNNGTWRISLGRLAGAVENHQAKIDGRNQRTTWIPLCHLFDEYPAPPGAGSPAGPAPGSPPPGSPPDAAPARCAGDAASSLPSDQEFDGCSD